MEVLIIIIIAFVWFLYNDSKEKKQELIKLAKLKVIIDESGCSINQAADLLAVPQEIIEITGEYGQFMEDLDSDMKLKSELILPLPKDKIKNALEKYLTYVTDKKSIQAAVTALAYLETFVPEDELPLDDLKKAEEGLYKYWEGRKKYSNLL